MLEEQRYENQDFSSIVVEENMEKQEFIHCSFQNADFSEISGIYYCKFEGCNFASSALNGVDIQSSAFLNCKFHHTNFFATTFDHCKMTGSSFLYTDASLWKVVGGDWSLTELCMLEFDKQTLQHVSFTGADLSGCRFTKCKLEECDFSQATVNGVSFFKSDIRGSILNEIDVLAIDMKEAIVDLQQCVLIAEATGVKYKP